MARFDPAAPLVHPLPDPERVEVEADLAYTVAAGRELAMDLYRPAGLEPGVRLPAVLLVHGEADPALLRGVRGWGQFTGWGRLLAGEGLATVAFEHRAIAEAGSEAVVGEVVAAAGAVRARAGELGLDPDIDGFVAAATDRGLRVELVEHPDGHHGFDLVDDSDASRAVIRRIVGFLRHHLAA
jgi:acetyl esterase/lipase